MGTPIRLALIYGSARQKRFGDKVMAWAQSSINQHQEFDAEILDPRDFFTVVENDSTNGRDVSLLAKRIEQADAFIIVTPEYNHGYPAHLKMLIDSAYFEWNAKPVAFISYGGLSGGIRAVEQLRQVFAELHAVTIRDSVSFANVWDQFDQQGKLIRSQRAEKAMASMLAQLRWWASTLRTARNNHPYQEVVE